MWQALHTELEMQGKRPQVSFERENPEFPQRAGRILAEEQTAKLQEQRRLFSPRRQAGEGSLEEVALGNGWPNPQRVLS